VSCPRVGTVAHFCRAIVQAPEITIEEAEDALQGIKQAVCARVIQAHECEVEECDKFVQQLRLALSS